MPPQQNSTLHIHVLVGKHPNKVSVKIWHLKKSLVFGKWWLESFFVFSIYFFGGECGWIFSFSYSTKVVFCGHLHTNSARNWTVAYCSKKTGFSPYFSVSTFRSSHIFDPKNSIHESVFKWVFVQRGFSLVRHALKTEIIHKLQISFFFYPSCKNRWVWRVCQVPKWQMFGQLHTCTNEKKLLVASQKSHHKRKSWRKRWRALTVRNENWNYWFTFFENP